MLPATERERLGAATAFRPLAQGLQRGASARGAGHADIYHPSAKRLDERVKPRLYPLGTEVRRVDAAGFIGLEGGRGYVGEAFIGVDVAAERSETSVYECEAWTARHLSETQTASGLPRQGLGNQADQAARELMAKSANFVALHGDQFPNPPSLPHRANGGTPGASNRSGRAGLSPRP